MKLKNKITITLIAIVFVSAGCAYALSFILGKIFPDQLDMQTRQMAALMLRTFLTSGTLIILIVLGVRKLIKPLTDLASATNEVAAGNFSTKIRESDEYAEIDALTRNFNAMVVQLRSNEYMKKDFIQNVSHEFQTPLAILSGYIQMLGGSQLSGPEREKFAALAGDEIGRLSSMTSNILLLSKLETQTALPSITRFSLDEQLRQVILALEPKWSAKSLIIHMDLVECGFTGYEELLEQVWINLIDNAIKFTPEQGGISVALTVDAGRIRLNIADSGIGISEEDQDLIYEKFYQCDISHRGGGTGLGLSIAKRAIDLHKGTIAIESTVGKGTVFRVELPANVNSI